MLNFSTSTKTIGGEHPMLDFSAVSNNAKGLFDHRTNQRAHPGRGGSPRG